MLGYVIGRALYDRHPKEPEGYLSRRYNVLVARETCAEVGRELGLPALVRLGKQARDDGANQSDNVIGDVVEALIGALAIDGGSKPPSGLRGACGSLTRRTAQGPQASQVRAAGTRRREGVQAAGLRGDGRTGAHHQPKFTIRVSVPGLGEATGRGHEQAGSGNAKPPKRCLNKLQRCQARERVGQAQQASWP